MFNSRYCHGKCFFGDDDSQNMFVYQPNFNMWELKLKKSTEYVTCWKSKGIYNFKLKPLHGAFLPNIKTFASKIGI